MNEIALTNTSLPERFEDVAAFAIVAQEKLKSVRAEINAVKRLGLAKDVLAQKIAEAQEIAEEEESGRLDELAEEYIYQYIDGAVDNAA